MAPTYNGIISSHFVPVSFTPMFNIHIHFLINFQQFVIPKHTCCSILRALLQSRIPFSSRGAPLRMFASTLNFRAFQMNSKQMHNKEAWRQRTTRCYNTRFRVQNQNHYKKSQFEYAVKLLIPKGHSTTHLGALISWPLILVLIKSLQSDYSQPCLQCKTRAALASPETSSLSCLSQHLFSDAWLPRWISIPNFERLQFKRLGGEKNHGPRVLLLSSWRIDTSKTKQLPAIDELRIFWVFYKAFLLL